MSCIQQAFPLKKSHMMFWRKILSHFLTLQKGPAHRVIFYYFGEEPTFLDEVYVTLYRNGVVEVEHLNEHVCTHIQNVEILWKSRVKPTGIGTRNLSLVKSEIYN